MQLTLRQDAYNGTQRTFNVCSFDFDGAESGTDYNILQAHTGTYLGNTVKFISFTVPIAGMNRLTGYSDDPTSTQNICPPPTVRVYQSSGAWYADTEPDAVAMTVGTKPEDWDDNYNTKYYTQSTFGYGSITIIRYHRPSATWDSTVQYYKIDDRQHTFYTDDAGYFGVARYFYRYYLVSEAFGEFSAAFVPYGTTGLRNTLTISGAYTARSGGMSGSAVFNADTWTQAGLLLNPISLPAQETTITGRQLQQFCECTYNDDKYIGVIMISVTSDGIPNAAYFAGITQKFWTARTPHINYGGVSGINFGRGTFTDPSQPVGIPSIPSSLTATDYGAGMHIRLLALDTGVSALFSQLWSQTGFWSMWQNLRFDPLSAIVSLHVLPTQISGTTVSSLSIALTKIAVSNSIPPSRIVDINLGTIAIDEYYGNRLDYSATNCSIFLPFIGDYPLDLMDVMGGSLSLTYRIDIATGDCVAFLLGTDRRGLQTMSKEYKGNCAFRLPVSGSDNGGAGLMSALSSMVGGAVSLAAGNVVGGAASLIGGAVDAATAKVNTTAPQVQGSASSMGVLTPYIKIYRASQVRPETYAEITADTSQIGGTVTTTSDGYPVTGFTVYSDVELTVQATQQEIDELRSILRGGIYV